ncbi:MAG: alpha/beta hydrolase [Phenylobacterium sp.]
MRQVLMSLAVLAMAAGGAVAAPVTARVAPEVVGADNYPPVRAAFPGGVTGLPNLTYSTIQGYQPLKLDLYLPAAHKALKPLVIYVHGGGWTGGHSRAAGAFADFPAVLAGLASRGYVVASLNYRLSGEARFPAAIDDVRAAIRWLRAHAREYGIDSRRVAVWGGSAGGQLAALVATDCQAGDDCVQAAAIWYGVFDFAALPQRPARGGGPDAPNAYLGCRIAQCPEVVAAASPIAHVDASDPPMLLIWGSADRTVPPDQSRAMAARLKAAGVRTQVLEIADVDHSFIGRTPAATTAASLKALQATFDFIDSTVGRRR